MSGKSPKIAEWIRDCIDGPYPAHYLAWFKCFNRGCYYEAHDVLEELWLQGGKVHPDYRFFKGLIQAAGGFVHMRLHYYNPDHRVHGQRLHPAARLLRLAISNTSAYPAQHMGIDLPAVLDLCRQYEAQLTSGGYVVNPWHPEVLPQVPVPHGLHRTQPLDHIGRTVSSIAHRHNI